MKLKELARLVGLAFMRLGVTGGLATFESGGQLPSEVPMKGYALAMIKATAATLTLTEADSGRTVVLDRAAGVTVTLPRATGSGAVYEFFTKTTVTSNNNIIQVANTNDVLSGQAAVNVGGADNEVFLTAAASDTITMNGTTKGGVLGDRIVIQDVAEGIFNIMAQLAASGIQVTPFSAAV